MQLVISFSAVSIPSFTKKALAIIALCLPVYEAAADDKWQLKKESDGIKIYTASVPDANNKAIKAEFNAEGTPAQLAAVLMDIDAQKDWCYSTKSASLVKKISDHELIYYTEKSLPWPLSNRDGAMHLKIDQDPVTHVMTINVVSANDIVAVKSGIVRVKAAKISWVVTPVDANTMSIVYQAQLDPAGAIPSWVTNMCCTKGPYETFKNLRVTLASDNYRLARF